MKKSEAVTKWCPMYRVQAHMGEYVDNRAGFDPVTSACLTDACMLWRSEVEFHCPKCDSTRTYSFAGGCPVCPATLEKVETGYCGLAK